LSKKLCLYDGCIFFEEWIPYDERSNYLTEADIGIITHPNHIETRFSHRTRIADYIWANLPIIITQGGTLSDLVDKDKLGITVTYNNTESLTYAILKLLEDKQFYNQCKENIKRISWQFRWDRVLEPLNEFCRNPRLAPDKPYLEKWRFRIKRNGSKQGRFKYYSEKIKDIYEKEGLVYTTKYCLRKVHEYGCKTIFF